MALFRSFSRHYSIFSLFSSSSFSSSAHARTSVLSRRASSTGTRRGASMCSSRNPRKDIAHHIWLCHPMCRFLGLFWMSARIGELATVVRHLAHTYSRRSCSPCTDAFPPGVTPHPLTTPQESGSRHMSRWLVLQWPLHYWFSNAMDV